jgi:hypothetical protein
MESFEINIPQEKLDDLKSRLKSNVFPDDLENPSWNYGVPLEDVKGLVEYWINKYDWRKEESRLNESLPQFTTDIEVDGFGVLNVHLVHKESTKEGAIPLLFCHGCKSSE